MVDVRLVVDGHRKFVLWSSQMLGKTMQVISQAQKENEEEVVLLEQNTEHVGKWEVPVSYTHLTLPTIYSV